jgi:hypothetical protein
MKMPSKKKRNSKTKTQKLQSRTFTKEDFNSGDGMMTATWGPALWHYLHVMSFNYPVKPTTEDKRKYTNFLKSMQHVLPCKYCRINLAKNFTQKPITPTVLESRETFSKYIYDLHELVNKMLCKPSTTTFEEVQNKYESFRSRCSSTKSKQKKTHTHIKTRKRKKKESGCIRPLNGKKSKCIIKIVPA